MTARERSHSDRAADVVDVTILDIAAHLEALLRSVRNLQQNALRLRGVIVANPDNMDPADAVRARLQQMLEECAALRELLNSAIIDAREL